MGKGTPQRPKPSLPKLRCLDAAVDAADVEAGNVVSGTLRELVEAIDESHWRAKRGRLEDHPRVRRARRARGVNPSPAISDRPAEIVPAEALVRPAPVFPSEEPAMIPRPRTAPPVRDLTPPRPGKRNRRGRVPPADARVVVIDVDNPYGVAAGATAALQAPPAGAKGLLNGSAPREWHAPQRDRIQVAAAVRDDAPGKMFARHQIDRACFLAAREYERLTVLASARLSSSAGALERVSGARNQGDFAALENQRLSAAKLASVDDKLRGRCGDMGVDLVQDVLKRGLTIEAAGEVRGETDRQEIRFLGSLFRRCLRELAVVLGFANRIGSPRS